MKALDNTVKRSALAASFVIGSVFLAGAASAPKAVPAAKAERCPLTDAQRHELSAIQKESATLATEKQPASERIDQTLHRITLLSQDLTRCLEPEIQRMVAQAGGTISGNAAAEIRATAMRLATELEMPEEERARLTEQLKNDIETLRAETSDDAASSRELAESNRIFNNKIFGELGDALNILDKAKNDLLRLRR